jgi:hypothetical protein
MLPLAQVFMLSWSYIVAVITEPGRVPPGWTPFATSEVGSHALLDPQLCCDSTKRAGRWDAAMQEAALESDRYERGDTRAEKGVAGSGRPRYCRKCQVGLHRTRMLSCTMHAQGRRAPFFILLSGAGLEAGAGAP